MEMFALDAEVAKREGALGRLAGAERLAALVSLAWDLRQRNTRRALKLADEADTLIETLDFSARERQSVGARLQLVRSEAKWLFAELDVANALADNALEAFTRLADEIGCADAHWLRAFIAFDRGNVERSAAGLEATVLHASRASDVPRIDTAQAVLAMWESHRDPGAAEARWASVIEGQLTRGHPAVTARATDFLSALAFDTSDYGRAIALLLKVRETALATGQLRLAITASINISCAFDNLNDLDASLEWSQRALDVARGTGWPTTVGLCLAQTGHTLWALGRLDAAEAALREALSTLAPLARSRSYASALFYLGELLLDRKDYQAALDAFSQLEQRAAELNHADLRIEAARTQARALLQLERPTEALSAASSALVLARSSNNAQRQIEALQIIAEIHAAHELAPPTHMTEASASLHYLQQALEVAGTIDGYTVPAALLDALARAHAKTGNHAQAYSVSIRAAAAREKTHSKNATNRAIALEVRQKSERAQAEAEHHRHLAAVEATRAQDLQETNATLEGLGAIGQEITSCLDAAAVFKTLESHVNGLLDATSFSVYLAEPDGLALTRAFGVEDGQSLPANRIELSHPTANSARCARERREISIELAPGANSPNRVAGTLAVMSALFAPLCVGDRLLGVMTLQSPQPNAYGERERLIFRTLCACGAIALDNAATYATLAATLTELRVTQAELVRKNLELEGAYRTMQEVSLTDPLTGLRNRRFLNQHIEIDVGLCLRRYERWLDQPSSPMPVEADLVFLVVDLDHFKVVNDRHGHAAGDKILVQMRQRLEEVLRDTDYLVRWGGEEFLVVARDTNRADANNVAERIRAAVANRPFDLGEGVFQTQTCSIGFACFPFLPGNPRLVSWSQIVELADQGLYLAKHDARNAWAGLFGTARTRHDAVLQFMTKDPREAERSGELRIETGKGPAEVAIDTKRDKPYQCPTALPSTAARSSTT